MPIGSGCICVCGAAQCALLREGLVRSGAVFAAGALGWAPVSSSKRPAPTHGSALGLSGAAEKQKLLLSILLTAERDSFVVAPTHPCLGWCWRCFKEQASCFFLSPRCDHFRTIFVLGRDPSGSGPCPAVCFLLAETRSSDSPASFAPAKCAARAGAVTLVCGLQACCLVL